MLWYQIIIYVDLVDDYLFAAAFLRVLVAFPTHFHRVSHSITTHFHRVSCSITTALGFAHRLAFTVRAALLAAAARGENTRGTQRRVGAIVSVIGGGQRVRAVHNDVNQYTMWVYFYLLRFFRTNMRINKRTSRSI